METSNWIAAIFAMILPNMGALSILFIDEQAKFRDWYEMLNFSSLQPPNWVFCPTWTTLYATVGFGSYLVWRDGNGFSEAAMVPLIIYGAHLLCNWIWSPVIYGLRSVKWNFIAILPLTLSVYATGVLFFRINHTAGYLFVPYALWCSFVTYLSYRLYRLNPPERAIYYRDSAETRFTNIEHNQQNKILGE